MELEHWREKFQGKECVQVFLHYNNRETPGARENMFDKRPHLDFPLGLNDDIFLDGGVSPPHTTQSPFKDIL